MGVVSFWRRFWCALRSHPYPVIAPVHDCPYEAVGLQCACQDAGITTGGATCDFAPPSLREDEMDGHSETRKALWTQVLTERIRAQEYDREAEQIRSCLERIASEAAECRRRAAEFESAAETLGQIDSS